MQLGDELALAFHAIHMDLTNHPTIQTQGGIAEMSCAGLKDIHNFIGSIGIAEALVGFQQDRCPAISVIGACVLFCTKKTGQLGTVFLELGGIFGRVVHILVLGIDLLELRFVVFVGGFVELNS